jgi:hypothetical protein
MRMWSADEHRMVSRIHSSVDARYEAKARTPMG